MDSKITMKRLNNEFKRFVKEPLEHIDTYVNPDDMFVWYFLVKGPEDSQYKGGYYMGKIILTPGYPKTPVDFMMLTPNGRFDINSKICLTNSGYHADQWTPMWTMHNILIAFLSIMVADDTTGISHIKRSPEERAMMAAQSFEYNVAHNPGIFEKFTRFIEKVDGKCRPKQLVESVTKSSENDNEIAVGQKVEPIVEQKVEPIVEQKVEPTVEHIVEHIVEPKAKPKKVAKKIMIDGEELAIEPAEKPVKKTAKKVAKKPVLPEDDEDAEPIKKPVKKTAKKVAKKPILSEDEVEEEEIYVEPIKKPARKTAKKVAKKTVPSEDEVEEEEEEEEEEEYVEPIKKPSRKTAKKVVKKTVSSEDEVEEEEEDEKVEDMEEDGEDEEYIEPIKKSRNKKNRHIGKKSC